jgi:Ca2+:H+ antiporter
LYSDDNAIQSTKYVKKTKEERDAVETFVANTKAATTGFLKEKTKEGITFGGRPSTSPRPIDRTLSFSDIEEAQGTNLEETPAEEEEEEVAEPQMSAWMTILLLAVVTVVCFVDPSRSR